MRTTGRALRLYEGGIHGLVEAAVRDDGVVCRRYQERTSHGYRWGAWRVTSERVNLNALPATLESGLSTLYPNHRAKHERLRLPAAA